MRVPVRLEFPQCGVLAAECAPVDVHPRSRRSVCALGIAAAPSVRHGMQCVITRKHQTSELGAVELPAAEP